jgi:hypothetical protein
MKSLASPQKQLHRKSNLCSKTARAAAGTAAFLPGAILMQTVLSQAVIANANVFANKLKIPQL